MITLYTIGCPKCRTLERRLQEANINYTTCTDINTMKNLGIKTAPYLSVNNELMDFTRAFDWATQIKNRHEGK